MRYRVDLRSDTVTTPSEAMRRAMAAAEVGDDWYGDDPTVNRLQELAAELTGKEAAIYVPTGTMANQIGLQAARRRGRAPGAVRGAFARRDDGDDDLGRALRRDLPGRRGRAPRA